MMVVCVWTISDRNPIPHGKVRAVITDLFNSPAWFQLRPWISKTIILIFTCMFYVFPVYFDGKFGGGALANWYGKLAPVVDRCFEMFSYDWIFAFCSPVCRAVQSFPSPKQSEAALDRERILLFGQHSYKQFNHTFPKTDLYVNLPSIPPAAGSNVGGFLRDNWQYVWRNHVLSPWSGGRSQTDCVITFTAPVTTSDLMTCAFWMS